MEREDIWDAIEALHEDSFVWAVACCGGDRRRAEDVLQTVYLKVLDERARFGGRASVKTWLFAVIRNTAASSRRKAERRRLHLVSPPAAVCPGRSPEQHAAASERRRTFRRALAELSERQRQVLELVFYHDLSVREAAEVMGTSVGSARVHYDRGKKAMLARLGPDGEGERR